MSVERDAGEMREYYDFSGGVRGRYAARYAEGVSVERLGVEAGVGHETRALTENDVVQAVGGYLSAHGYRVERMPSTAEQGVDIVAVHPQTGARLLVEAKGGTSSKPDTKRFGKPFTPNQARSHVSVAFYAAAKLLHEHPRDHTRVAMAFPDDRNHRSLVERIRSAIDTLGIEVFFVDASRGVSVLGGG